MSNCSDHPTRVFGTCRRCGGEPPEGFSTLSGADADRYSDQNVYLVLYRGEWMCERCKDNIIMDDESLVKRDKVRDAQKFLSRVGFVDEIT